MLAVMVIGLCHSFLLSLSCKLRCSAVGYEKASENKRPLERSNLDSS